jgi:hypothetical protein
MDLLAGVSRVIWANPAELLCCYNSLQQSRLAVPLPVPLAIPMPAGSVYLLALWLVCTTHYEKLSVCIVNEIYTNCTVVSISRSWQSQFILQALSIFTLNMLRQTIRFIGKIANLNNIGSSPILALRFYQEVFLKEYSSHEYYFTKCNNDWRRFGDDWFNWCRSRRRYCLWIFSYGLCT